MGISTNYCDILQGVSGCGEHILKMHELGKFPPKTFITIIDAILRRVLSKYDPNFKGFKLYGADMPSSEIEVVCDGDILIRYSICEEGPNHLMKVSLLLDIMFRIWISSTKYDKEVVNRTHINVMRVIHTNAGYDTMDYVINEALSNYQF